MYVHFAFTLFSKQKQQQKIHYIILYKNWKEKENS